jgi:small GTP-binding protein
MTKTQLQKKVCMLGDFSVGKTSLVRRFVYDLFEDKYLSTIGVKITRKSVELTHDVDHLLVWDLAGGEEFSGTQTSYLQGASGGILVCDLTRKKTLSILENYAGQLQKIRPNAALILVANKSDLINEQEISQADLELTANKLDAKLFVTSAKTGENVETAFYELASSFIAK